MPICCPPNSRDLACTPCSCRRHRSSHLLWKTIAARCCKSEAQRRAGTWCGGTHSALATGSPDFGVDFPICGMSVRGLQFKLAEICCSFGRPIVWNGTFPVAASDRARCPKRPRGANWPRKSAFRVPHFCSLGLCPRPSAGVRFNLTVCAAVVSYRSLGLQPFAGGLFGLTTIHASCPCAWCYVRWIFCLHEFANELVRIG